MARIESGVPDDDTNAALLQGMQVGRAWREARDSRAQEERLRAKAIMDFFEEARKTKKSEREALDKHNQGVRDSKALAAWGALLEREKQNPKFRARAERKGLVEKSLKGLAERGVSEDTIQRILGHVKDTESSLKERDEQQAFEEFLQGAEKDQHLTPEEAQVYRAQNAAGGNRAGMIEDIHQRREKAAATEAYAEENAMEFEKAQQFAMSLPEGSYERSLSIAMAKQYARDSKKQETPGTGADLYFEMQKLAMGQRENFAKTKKKLDAAALGKPAIGLGGMTVGQMQREVGKEPHRGIYSQIYDPGAPEIPPLDASYKSYAQGLRSELERRYPPQVPASYGWDFQSNAGPGGTPDIPRVTPGLPPEDTAAIVQDLMARGIPLTPTNLAEARRARAAGGG